VDDYSGRYHYTLSMITCNDNVHWSMRLWRTAYDVLRYTSKLSNRFRLQVYERLVRTSRFSGQSLWMHPNSIYSSVAVERDRPKCGSSRSQWI